jgi:hypothetical protein
VLSFSGSVVHSAIIASKEVEVLRSGRISDSLQSVTTRTGNWRWRKAGTTARIPWAINTSQIGHIAFIAVWIKLVGTVGNDCIRAEYDTAVKTSQEDLSDMTLFLVVSGRFALDN